MTNVPIVSIIIPVYQTYNYLEQCLDSIISQTYNNLDIIIINDGCTDGSKEVCEAYALRDKRIRLFHTENNGLSKARNFGIQKSTGEFLSFIDSDDWIELNAIELLVKAAIKYDADIITAGSCSEYVGKTIHQNKVLSNERVFKGELVLPAYFQGLFGDAAWNKLYRRECFDIIHFPEGRCFEDAFVTWRLMKRISDSNGIIVVIIEELYHFRMRKSSISHTKTFDIIRDNWFARLDKFNGLLDYQSYVLPGCFIAIGWLLLYYEGFTEVEKKSSVDIIMEMERFSRKYFLQVLKGKYPGRIKLSCLLSQRITPLLLWCVFYGNKLYTANRVFRRKMYD